MAAGMPLILVGLLCFMLSNVVDGGFLKGFFQGATIALMILGAYILGAGMWFSRKAEEDLRDGKHWLPSRDGRGDGSR